jgi:hypothetical protein
MDVPAFRVAGLVRDVKAGIRSLFTQQRIAASAGLLLDGVRSASGGSEPFGSCWLSG